MVLFKRFKIQNKERQSERQKDGEIIFAATNNEVANLAPGERKIRQYAPMVD
jgi:hypothetical protein